MWQKILNIEKICFPLFLGGWSLFRYFVTQAYHVDMIYQQGVVVDKFFENTLKEIQEDRILLVRYQLALGTGKAALASTEDTNVFNIDPVRILFFMKQHLRTIDLFLKYDKDHSGSLSREEMKYAFEVW